VAGLDTDRSGDILLFHIEGEVDLTSAATLEEAMIEELPGASAIVVDLSGVTFFDSSGVRMLDRMAGRCDGAGVGFRVAAPPNAAARLVLRLAVFREDLVAAGIDEALAELREEA
jgi:anti-sigma B factor antagonist